MNLPAIVIIAAFVLAVLILSGAEIYFGVKSALEDRREAEQDIQDIVRAFSKVEK